MHLAYNRGVTRVIKWMNVTNSQMASLRGLVSMSNATMTVEMVNSELSILPRMTNI
mgnify:CR=1 FL=1